MKLLNKLLFLTVVFISLLWACTTVADPDLWGHVKFGIDSLSHGTVLHRDIYSYTAQGEVWINHEWLTEIIFGFLFVHFAAYGLVFLKFVIGLATLFLVYLLIKQQTDYFFERSLVYLILIAQMIHFLSMVRPQLFSYLFYSLYLYLFFLIYRDKKCTFKRLVWFPLIMLFWVNLHGGFLAGVAFLGLFVFSMQIEERRISFPLLAVFFITLAATVINPYGTGLHAFLYRSLSVSRPILEWGSLSPEDISSWLVIGAFLCVLLFSPGKKMLTPMLCFFAALYMGIRHIKFFPFFLLTCAFVIPRYSDELVSTTPAILSRLRKETVFNGVQKLLLVVLFSGILLLLSWKIVVSLTNPFTDSAHDYPYDAVTFMKKEGLEGNLLCKFGWGEYCIWYLYPESHVFIDGRFRTVFPQKIERAYFNFDQVRDSWDEVLTDYPTQMVLWPAELSPAVIMRTQKDWELIYEDTIAVLFARKDFLEEKVLEPIANSNDITESGKKRVFP